MLANRQQPADDFTESLISSDIQTIAEQKQNRQQPVDDFKLLFFIPWGHHCRILEKCKDNMPKALFFVRNYAKISRIAKNELFMSFSPQQR